MYSVKQFAKLTMLEEYPRLVWTFGGLLDTNTMTAKKKIVKIVC
jgi:hypothetical protein